MTKQELAVRIEKSYREFITKINGLSDDDFLRSPNQKWTAGQQLEHIIQSVIPVQKAFELPKTVLEAKFGTTNRTNKDYDELVTHYLLVLKENQNYVLPEKFDPARISLKDKKAKLDFLETLIEKLIHNMLNYNDHHLETQILPHPLMGKLTLREILYFTAYHVKHHDQQILKNLKT